MGSSADHAANLRLLVQWARAKDPIATIWLYAEQAAQHLATLTRERDEAQARLVDMKEEVDGWGQRALDAEAKLAAMRSPKMREGQE